MKKKSFLFLLFLIACHCSDAQKTKDIAITVVVVYANSTLSDVSHHPVGINLDYFMDGGRYPNGQKMTTIALQQMGVKYLRYPGGDKSDLNLFSVPPYDKARPTLAEQEKERWMIMQIF